MAEQEPYIWTAPLDSISSLFILLRFLGANTGSWWKMQKLQLRNAVLWIRVSIKLSKRKKNDRKQQSESDSRNNGSQADTVHSVHVYYYLTVHFLLYSGENSSHRSEHLPFKGQQIRAGFVEDSSERVLVQMAPEAPRFNPAGHQTTSVAHWCTNALWSACVCWLTCFPGWYGGPNQIRWPVLLRVQQQNMVVPRDPVLVRPAQAINAGRVTFGHFHNKDNPQMALLLPF